MKHTKPISRESALGYIADARALLAERRGATPNADLEALLELDPASGSSPLPEEPESGSDTTEDQS